jgi:pimeloyl-ACP methyl ester carboxylesterase
MSGGCTDELIATNGIRLHVVTAGDPKGRPVVLLHGFPEFWYGWRHQIPALAEAGFRVIVPDQRGYNLSDKPRGVRAYRMEALVSDVLGLLDHYGCEKAALAGHDWGAAVAWSLAIAFPQRVGRLAILNVPHPAVMWDFIRRSPVQMLKSWYIAFFQIPGLADRLLGLNDYAAAVRMLTASGRRGTFSAAELDEYKKAWSRPGALTASLNWYRAILRDRPAAAADQRVHVPVLVLWGKKDVALSAGMAARSLELCDDGRLVYFENASHWVQHDEAQQVNRELIEFFLP